MSNNYTRQSSGLIINGATIQASHSENEFAQLALAFNGSTGHTHDGTTGMGQVITSIGTITTGVWNGTIITGTYGGTGVNNGANTITLGGNINTANSLTTSGNFALTLTLTGATNVTLPTTGTLITSGVTTLNSLTSATGLTTLNSLTTATALASIGTVTSGVWNATGIGATYGGTGSAFFQVSGPASSIKTYTFPNASCNVLTDNAVLTGAQGGTGIANTSKTITLGGNISTAGALTTLGAFTTTLTATNTTALTLPTTGTVLSNAVTATLAVGYAVTPFSAGTKTTGTFTPSEANGAWQYVTNGGAHTLAPPTNATNLVLEYTNNGSAGAITTSGFTKVDGTFDTTNAHKFFCYITKHQTYSYLNIVALQ